MKMYLVCLLCYVMTLELIWQIHGIYFGTQGDFHVREKRDADVENSCEVYLSDCFSPVENKYGNLTDIERANAFRTSGANEACSDYLAAHRCADYILTKCPLNNEYLTQLYKKGAMIVEYQCVTKAKELNEQWNCVTNVDVQNGFDDCERRAASLSDCNYKEKAQCLADIAANTEDCEPTSHNYLEDLERKIESIMNPNCQSNTTVF